MKIVVTGGAGFIGSHTVVELIEQGHTITIIDNLSNSYFDALIRIARLCFGSDVKDLSDPRVSSRLTFHNVDLQDNASLLSIFKATSFDGVIHFAALKAVGESCQFPLLYWSNNVYGTTNLLRCMEQTNVHNIIFSSSACVYGEPERTPILEDFPTKPANPYGNTKCTVETLLRDTYNSAKDKWRVVVLRYFNPIGAHPSGIIGEDPRSGPFNLMPILAQVGAKRKAFLPIYGNDYSTPDKTAIRDYIHVMDLAKGHVAALSKFGPSPSASSNGEGDGSGGGFWTYNLGTGRGYSVLEVVKSYEEQSGQEIPYVFSPRRSGDVPILVADPTLANKELGWKAEKQIQHMCRDFYNWLSMNPNGFNK